MIYEEIYRVVGRIPRGTVVTYGWVAKRVRVSPRVVGNALHKNTDPQNIPCHRVVDRNGKLAKGYAFGGVEAQKEKLVVEGVVFKDRIHVDLRESLWKGGE